jgi:flagellar hook-basal body complex protein FliE
MRVESLSPDTAPVDATPQTDGSAFTKALDAIGAVLDGATQAENAFAKDAGSLQEAVYERARADVALSVVTAAAQRSAQALQSILNMQV